MKSFSVKSISARSVSLSVAAAFLALALSAAAQSAPGPVVVVDFSNPGLDPSHWTLTLRPDGSAHYSSESTHQAAGAGDEFSLPSVSRDIHLNPKFAAHVFDTARRHAWFNQDCESHLKVAFQGLKKFTYSGPEGGGSCTFNYSKDKDMQALSDSMMAVSLTVLEGVKLEMLLRHDPLGLDKEMGNLTSAAHDGRAQQICAIRAILEQLAQDDHVMDMVRKQARLLLAQSDS